MARSKPSEPKLEAVALYARTSTEDQRERDTVQSQLDFLRRFVDLHGITVADEYVDDGVSGTVPLEDRPEGRRLLHDAETGRFGVVLVYRLDRLGRSLRSLLSAHDALDRHGVAIRSATEPFDTSSPIGGFLFQLLGSLAELEKSTISERTSLGKNRVASNGQYTGGLIPLGYELDEARCFVPSERLVPELGTTESQLVRDLFARIASGQSTLNAECARLTALGVPRVARYGGKDGKTGKVIERDGWRLSTMGSLIHNPVYRGEGLIESSYGNVTRPAPALVDAATWQMAQDALTRNRSLSRKNAKAHYLVRAMVRCAVCGKGFTGTIIGGSRQRVYRHLWSPHQSAPCEAKLLDADWLEEQTWAQCREFILNPGPALDVAREKLRERMATATGADDRRRELFDTLSSKEGERERVLSLFRKGVIDSDEAERELDAVAREAGQLRELLASIDAQDALLDAQEADLSQSAVLLAQLRHELAEIDATDDQTRKRAVIERFVREIRVKSRRIGPRKLEADVTLHLRLKPEPIAVENNTRSPAR